MSDEVVEEQFICDLNKCKGGCCEDGDAGAPLSNDELDILNRVYETVKPYLTPEGIKEIENRGRYLYDREFGWVTPTIGGKMCAYGFRDAAGIIKCGIEQAYYDGKIEWKKPISCHLYPIKTASGRNGELEYVNYEPRQGLCNPGCALGKKMKTPVYQFLKDALVRKYGDNFYEALDQAAHEYFKSKN